MPVPKSNNYSLDDDGKHEGGKFGLVVALASERKLQRAWISQASRLDPGAERRESASPTPWHERGVDAGCWLGAQVRHEGEGENDEARGRSPTGAPVDLFAAWPIRSSAFLKLFCEPSSAGAPQPVD